MMMRWFVLFFSMSVMAKTYYHFRDAEGRVLLTDNPRLARGMELVKTFRFSYAHPRSGGNAPSIQALKKKIRHYQPIIQQAAAQYDLDADLIHAIILAESAYDDQARSKRGAMGLMQLMPATARRFGVQDPWNGQQNIRGGTAYLAWLKKYFQGDMDKVIAAYNAGENAVKKYRGIPPYRETQYYVQKVRSFWQKGLSAFD